MKKVTVAIAALAAVGFAGAAMAAPVNPWGPVTVPVKITVEKMTELWSEGGTVALSIVDGGMNQGSQNAVTKTLYHLHNSAVHISASIDGHIPDNTQFHILVNPAASWTDFDATGADKVLSWRREGGHYLPNATGGGQTVVGINTPAIALSPASNAGFNSSDDEAKETIGYFADSSNIMAAEGVNPNFNVVWTIAPQ